MGSHRLPLDEAPEAYRIFDEHAALKVVFDEI
jgi:threonine dehydrogenase-like Zn-dependent dehydrogenase